MFQKYDPKLNILLLVRTVKERWKIEIVLLWGIDTIYTFGLNSYQIFDEIRNKIDDVKFLACNTSSNTFDDKLVNWLVDKENTLYKFKPNTKLSQIPNLDLDYLPNNN